MLYGGIAASELRFAPVTRATFAGIGHLTVSGSLTNPNLQASAAFSGAGSVSFGDTIRAFAASLPSSATLSAGYSWRQVVTPLSSGGSHVRVTFRAGSTAGTLAQSHLSVGVQNTTYNTVSTPVELMFGGVSGFSIASNQSITSDWATLSFLSSGKLVVIGDAGPSGGGPQAYASSGVTGCVLYSLAATDSYNVASPAGSWTEQSNTCLQVQSVEVQSVEII